MMPNKIQLDEDVEKNFERMFDGIKLTKKAEKVVRDLLSNTVGLTYKLKYVIKLHNQQAKVADSMSDILNHKFTYPESKESNEDQSQEASQKSTNS